MRGETAPRNPAQTVITTASAQTTGPACTPTHQMVTPYRMQPASVPTTNSTREVLLATSRVSSPIPVIINGQNPQRVNPMVRPNPANRAGGTVSGLGIRVRYGTCTGSPHTLE